MKPRLTRIILITAACLILAACRSRSQDVVYLPGTNIAPPRSQPRPEATLLAEQNTATPTVSTAPSTPTAVETPIIAVEPQVITSQNIQKLTWNKTAPINLKKIDVYTGRWHTARWTMDGKFLVVETNLGFDVLDGYTMELVGSYDGYHPVDVLVSGEIAAQKGKEISFIDPASKTITPKMNIIVPDIVSVSPDRQFLAYGTGEDTLLLVNINTGETRNITLTYPVKLTGIQDLSFEKNSTDLLVTAQDVSKRSVLFLVDVVSGSQIYSNLIGISSPIPASDGIHYLYQEKSTIYYARPNNVKTAQAVDSTLGTVNTIQLKKATLNGANSGYLTLVGRSFSFTGQDNQLAILFNGQVYYGEPNNLQRFGEIRYSIEVWDMLTKQTVRSYKKLGTAPLQFGFTPDGTRFYTISFDGLFKLWNADTEKLINTAKNRYTLFDFQPALSPDGSKIALPYSDSVNVLDVKTMGVVSVIKHPENEPMLQTKVQFLSNDQIGIETRQWHLLTEENGLYGLYRTYIWDIPSQAILRQFNDAANCIYTSSNRLQICDKIIIYEVRKSVQILDTTSGEPIYTTSPESFSFITISPDASLQASCRQGNDRIFIQDPRLQIPAPYNFRCQDMRFLPDSKTLLLADGSLVDIASREIVLKFKFPQPLTNFPKIYFSPNNDFILIGSDFYDWKTGELLFTISGPSNIFGAALVNDGKELLLLTDRGLETWVVPQ